jgi:hypothetical protein
LNPFQSAAVNDVWPRDRDFGMTTEDVGFEQLGRDALLPRIDDFVAWRGGTDLFVVTRLNWIAKDDSHGGFR